MADLAPLRPARRARLPRGAVGGALALRPRAVQGPRRRGLPDRAPRAEPGPVLRPMGEEPHPDGRLPRHLLGRRRDVGPHTEREGPAPGRSPRLPGGPARRGLPRPGAGGGLVVPGRRRRRVGRDVRRLLRGARRPARSRELLLDRLRPRVPRDLGGAVGDDRLDPGRGGREHRRVRRVHAAGARRTRPVFARGPGEPAVRHRRWPPGPSRPPRSWRWGRAPSPGESCRAREAGVRRSGGSAVTA